MELAPNFLPTNHPYHTGDILTHNIYSWHLASNLIFIDLPAGVGYSINDDEKYVFDDVNTASDTLYALIHLFKEKFSEYHNNNFYIAGESYAGKFIPDLTLRINAHNKKDEE
jgi:carboxypeptidase C (cathepsin A)